ncbi:uncharacterized protein LAESUDRAFT_814664 [Laetiporus sulphureus 93-53]|uniref:F-box domain-containing protein n=1 Tax=Laetiporus sulphureus 93-53 TaxID=1314785 RepID=A0A165CWH9_9APHY|nr:uncharacterized protein LAESUDRAFT_814664 [Laetiporus sulphureus 93-53]KZT03592.1 hypothetical protein LAESUDRAFT_814664 [Laetiporus sulphureus 93-53]
MAARPRKCSLPVEVCERVVGYLDIMNEGDYRTLLNCALVSRGWYPASRAVFLETVYLKTRKQPYNLNHMLKVNPNNGLAERIRCVHLSGLEASEPTKKPAVYSPVSAFPPVFVRKLPNLRTLEICCINPWDHSIGRDFYLALGLFDKVESLTLRDITFPSLSEFAQFVCALPNLKFLSCEALRWDRHNPSPFIFLQHGPRATVSELVLKTMRAPMADAMDFLLPYVSRTDLRRLRVGPVSASDVKESRIQELLHQIGPSLQRITLKLDPAIDDERRHEEYFSLEKNIALETLSLEIKAFHEKTYDLSWLPPLLSSISSKQIRDIHIRLVIDTPQDVFDSVNAGFTPARCSLIDRTCTSSGFANLRRLAIQVFDYSDASMNKRRTARWCKRFAEYFSGLQKKQILFIEILPVMRY